MTHQLGFCVPELYGFPEVPYSARVCQAARVAFPRTRTAHEAQDEEPRFLEHFRGKRSERFVYLANEDPLFCCVHEYGAPQAVAFIGEALWVFAVVARCGTPAPHRKHIPLSPIPAAGTGGSAKGCC